MNRSLLGVAGVMLLCSTAGAQKSRPMSLHDIMALDRAGTPAISPDGRAIVYTVSGWQRSDARADTARGGAYEVRSNLWIVSTAEGSVPRQLTFGERDAAPAWSPDGRMLAFIAARETARDKDPEAQIWILPMDGGEPWQLTNASNGVRGFTWSHDGEQIAFLEADTLPAAEAARRKLKNDPQVYEANFRLSHIWVVSLETRHAREVVHGDFTVRNAPSWSPDDSRLAFGASPTPMLRDLRGRVYLLTLGSGELETISPAPHSPATQLAEPAWSPDGSMIAFVTVPQSDTVGADGIMLSRLGNGHLMIYDVAEKRIRDIHDPTFDFALGSIQWSPDSKRLVFAASDRAYESVFYYDVAANEFGKIAGEMLLGGLSYSADGKTAAFAMETSTAPADIYVSDASLASPRRLTDLNPQVRDLALGATEVVRWKSTDGTPVEGVLLKPVGYQPGKRYPLLVVAHGGPTGRTDAGFKASYSTPGQFWAGQGWAVLYPNPRGSTGYGEKFMRGNILDWGGGDYRDIMTGVDHLIALGVADSTRMAFEGWSYGGYMAAWVVTQSSRFKAAMMGAGISDVRSMYATTEIPGYVSGFFDGIPSSRTVALYRARSAVTHVDSVSTPLLILHGANDHRVPTSQALRYFRALRDRGKTVELVFYPREGHGLREYYHQFDKMQRTYDWISSYALGRKPEQAALR